MVKKMGRLGVVAGVVTFVRSPQGQQMIRRAQQWYADPAHQEQVRRAVTTSVAKVRGVAGRRQVSRRADVVDVVDVVDEKPKGARIPKTIAPGDRR